MATRAQRALEAQATELRRSLLTAHGEEWCVLESMLRVVLQALEDERENIGTRERAAA
jgi:hypothetical protein